MPRQVYRFEIGSMMAWIAVCGVCLALFRVNIGLGIVACCVGLLTLSRLSAIRLSDRAPGTTAELAVAWVESAAISFMVVLAAGCTLAGVVAALIWIPIVNVLSPFIGLAVALYVVGLLRRANWPPPAADAEGITWLEGEVIDPE